MHQLDLLTDEQMPFNLCAETTAREIRPSGTPRHPEREGLTIAPTGELRATGYGEIPVYMTQHPRPRLGNTGFGLQELVERIANPHAIPTEGLCWVFIEGADWRALVHADGESGDMLYTHIMGGIEDK